MIDKITSVFDGRVVRKDLASLVKGSLPVPTYVVEYLLAQYCAVDDEALIEAGVDKVKQIISNNYVHRADAERIKGLIHDKGHYMVIDKVSVELNDGKENQYEASFSNLNLAKVPISDNTVAQHPKLLSGNGVWCIVRVCYNNEAEGVKMRWGIETLKPIQISGIDVEEFITLRKEFTSDEWIDLLVQGIGLNPGNMTKRAKFIPLSRLLPHVENNYNYMELGPKGTGKSHVFQELSPHGVLVSGGDVTSARLFVKYSGNREIMGLVGYWDVVAWDEYEHQPGKRVDPVMIDTMQNYLANKSFNRGKGSHEASASMAFVGNTKHTVPYMLKNTHLFESIPQAFIKGAFLDRIHLYVPGWEVPILKKAAFSTSFGLITDYLAEILHSLRRTDYSEVMMNKVKFHRSLSERDSNAVRKTFSGLCKLIYPDKEVTDEEVLELVDFAMEGRKRVKDQLYRIDETFKAEPAKFEYTVLESGQEVSVETLENLNNQVTFDFDETIVEEVSTTVPAESIATGEASPVATESVAAKRKRIEYPSEAKTVSVRDNQIGVSYHHLFAAYLKGATKIRIEDPYIRLYYQMRNLVEFIGMLVKNKSPEEQIELHVVTWNQEDRMAESRNHLLEIQESAANVGIDFTFEFKQFHDRKIVSDNGWTMHLSRGLDIFEPRQGLSVDDFVSESRACKAFTVTYCRE